MATPQYSDSRGHGVKNVEMSHRRSSTNRHQPTPKILSSDQVFRAEEGDTLGKFAACSIAWGLK